MLSMEPEPAWEKPSIELPPGWHEAMQEVARMAGGVALKYVYAVAIDRFLSDRDVKAIEDAAWTMQRRARKDLKRVSEQHSAKEIEERFSRADSSDADKKSRTSR
jgi:hypothetical protein